MDEPVMVTSSSEVIALETFAINPRTAAARAQVERQRARSMGGNADRPGTTETQRAVEVVGNSRPARSVARDWSPYSQVKAGFGRSAQVDGGSRDRVVLGVG
ncbi:MULTISPECIES: hypothetical protein [Saccharothrix]|uniref:hypothetical protein n=1 Tax=Saccharothrix TaxID=2071 RepID=UPI001160F92B|nr:hypothetical protein [Saccharothrix sp. CB00851]